MTSLMRDLVPGWWDQSEAAWWSVTMEPEDREYCRANAPDKVWDGDPQPSGGAWIERRFRLFDSYPVQMEGWQHRRYYQWNRNGSKWGFAIVVTDRPSERAIA